MAVDKTLLQKFEDQMKNTNLSVQKAIQWFKDNTKILQNLNANLLMTRDRQRLVPFESLKGTILVGRMIMFFYNPKYRETLPYYDMFPLVMIVKMLPDGFLGLNLHYIPIMYRIRLLDSLHQLYKTREYDEKKKLQMSYSILNTISGAKYYKPCLKRYLYKGNDHRGGGVTSKFYVVDPAEWDKMIALPVERFMSKKRPGISYSQVQNESLRQIGIRKT